MFWRNAFRISILLTISSAVFSQTLFIKQTNRASKNHRVAFRPENLLTLAEAGQWKAVLVVPRGATPTTRSAANEMKSALERSLGAPIAVSETLVQDKINLLLGMNELSLSFVPDLASLPRDGFVIRHAKSSPDVIVIAGRDDAASDPEKIYPQRTFWEWFREKGTLYGACDFLERFCGVGFFFPNDMGMPVPKCSGIVVPSMDISEAPDFEERMWNYDLNSFVAMDKKTVLPAASDPILWVNRERLFYRHDTFRISYGHGIRAFNLNKRFAATKPELFSLLPNGQRDLESGEGKGHLCLMNPELENIIVSDALSYLKGEPPTVRDMQYQYPTEWHRYFAAGNVPIMLEDGFGPDNFCRCPLCAPFKRADGNDSDYVFGFYARVAKRIKESGVAGKVTTMAYSTYKKIPNIDLPDNMLLQVATPGPWAETGREYQKAEDDSVRAWNQKLGGGRAVSLWTYMNDYANRVPLGVPALSPRLVVSYFKRIGPSVRGAFLESEISYRFYNYINWYAFGKVAWDNEVDANALLLDHHVKMFGLAAEPMGKAYDLIERLWTSCLGGYENTTMGPVLKSPGESEIWDSIFSTERMNELTALVKEAEERAKNDPAALARVRYVAENLIGAVLRYRNTYLSTKRESEDQVLAAFNVSDDGIRLDGALDEEAWRQAATVYLVPLKRSEDPNAITSVRAAWSEKNLYVAFECAEGMMDEVSVLKRERDDASIWQDNSVEIFIGPADGSGRYYHMAINSLGSVSDWAVEGKKKEIAWDSGARVAVKRSDAGWVAEVVVPFAAIGGKPGAENILNFCRSRIMLKNKKLDQLQTWSPFLRQGFHEPERFGKIVFVKNAASMPDDGNLLVNGSFEKGDENSAEGWEVRGEGISIDAGTFRHGRRSGKISLSEATEKAVSYAHRLPDLKPNTEYVITYFVRTQDIQLKEGARYAGGFVNVWAGANYWFPPNAYEPTKSYQGTKPWTKESYVFKTGPTTKDCQVRFGFHPAKGTMWVDDIRIRENRK